jgi:hypothetical protein
MKKLTILILVLLVAACGSETEVVETEIPEPLTTITITQENEVIPSEVSGWGGEYGQVDRYYPVEFIVPEGSFVLLFHPDLETGTYDLAAPEPDGDAPVYIDVDQLGGSNIDGSITITSVTGTYAGSIAASFEMEDNTVAMQGDFSRVPASVDYE